MPYRNRTMSTTFTESQKKALDYQRHLSVTANAGSGKTMVLVQRYVDILLKTDVNVSDIVAITFTEKAASELKKKIADIIEKKITETTNRTERRRLESVRDGLASAIIGTIHSFCARLLRDFPVEAGVDANFGVLQGVDQTVMLQESITEAFDAALSDDQRKPQLMTTLRMLGRHTVEHIINSLVWKREQVERLLAEDSLYAKSDDEVLAFWQERIDAYIGALVNSPDWLEDMITVVEVAVGKLKPDVEKLLKQFETTSELQGRLSLYHQISKLALTQEPDIRRDFIGRNVDRGAVEPHIISLVRHYQSVKPFLELVSEEVHKAHTTLLQLTRTLLALYRDVIERYDKSKAENGQLDFEDLQLRAKLLLQNPEVRQRLADRYRFIMVDEYQDTNLLQYEILRPLITEYRTGNLFVVGDDKQSIYGFRGAEVEVFGRTKTEMVDLQKENKPFFWQGSELGSEAEEREGKLYLSESFRLLIDLVAFVNLVFEQTMGDHISDYEVEYTPLVKARRNSTAGKIEMLLLLSDSEDTSNTQEEMIARRIVKLVESGHAVWKESGGEETSKLVQFGDIAILLRSRTYLTEIEQALLKYNIPYIVSGGVGFYQTQEIYDFYNYFQFLLNTHDDIALVGILRSPFFGISDAELYQIALTSQDTDFWSKAQRFASEVEVSARIRYAVTTLQEDLEIANRMSIPFLINRILSQTGWLGAVIGGQRGELNIANVEKLLDIAREFEGKGFNNLFDFIERLKLLIAQEEREGQASVETSGRAVQVMTIHAAKGLEFPVVIIPRTERKFRYDKPPYLDDELGLGFNVVDPENYDESLTPPIATLVGLSSRHKTEAEEKRVFYVAATRARDMLVLAGRFDATETAPSYLRWTMDALGLSQMPITRRIKREIPTKVCVESGNGYEILEVNHAFEIQFFTSSEEIAIAGKELVSKEEVINFDTILLTKYESKAYSEFFSATQIQTYWLCPTKYYLRYRLGMPEVIGDVEFDEEAEANDAIHGALTGKITHELLEVIDADGQQDEMLIENVDKIVNRNGVIDPDKAATYRSQVLENVARFKTSEFGKSILSLKEFHCEYTVSAAFDGEFLTGTVDRLYRNEDGEWAILDYKTDSIDETQLLDRTEDYRFQMAFYALLVKRLFPKQSSVMATLFFTECPDKPQSLQFGEEELYRIQEDIRRCIRGIREGIDRAGDDLPTETPHCPKCDYFVKESCLMKS